MKGVAVCGLRTTRLKPLPPSIVFSSQKEVRDNLHEFSSVVTQLARLNTCSIHNEHIIFLLLEFKDVRSSKASRPLKLPIHVWHHISSSSTISEINLRHKEDALI
jgi:hypothetical protein